MASSKILAKMRVVLGVERLQQLFQGGLYCGIPVQSKTKRAIARVILQPVQQDLLNTWIVNTKGRQQESDLAGLIFFERVIQLDQRLRAPAVESGYKRLDEVESGSVTGSRRMYSMKNGIASGLRKIPEDVQKIFVKVDRLVFMIFQAEPDQIGKRFAEGSSTRACRRR